MNPKLLEHVRVLAGEIGCRMVGTPGNQAAAEYITSTVGRKYLANDCLDTRPDQAARALSAQVRCPTA